MSTQTDIQNTVSSNGGAYWRFEEASGTRLDTSPNGVSLTDNNAVGQSAGKVNNCASFVATSLQKLTSSSSIMQTGAIDFSFAGWFNLTSVLTAEFFCGKFGGAGNAGEYMFFFDGTTAAMRVYDSNNDLATASATTFGALSASTWYFIAGGHRVSSKQTWVSVNAGSKDLSSAYTGTLGTNGADFSLGDGSVGALYFGGLCDELLYTKSHELTATELTYLYNSGAGVNLYGSVSGGPFPMFNRRRMAGGMTRMAGGF